MRVFIISGQSNTLQSAVALATACHAAAQGMRVLLAGSGPRGLLSHLVGQTLDVRPVELKQNLAAMELVTLDEFARHWQVLCADPKVSLTARLRDIGTDELPNFPGMDEIAQLIVAERAAQLQKFDLLIFGGTTIESLMRGISMRETIRWVTRLVTGLSRGPGASRTSQDAAILPATVLNALSSAAVMQDLRVALERFSLWTDANYGTRIRLVLPAEEMTLPYMRYVMNGFGMSSMQVDTIFAQGDTTSLDPTVAQKLESRLVPMGAFAATPTDLDEWTNRGTLLYEQRPGNLGMPDEAELLPTPPRFAEQNEVRLHLPFRDHPNALDVGVASEEVIVRLGEFRRFLLISGMEKGGNLRARVEGDTLRLWVEMES